MSRGDRMVVAFAVINSLIAPYFAFREGYWLAGMGTMCLSAVTLLFAWVIVRAMDRPWMGWGAFVVSFCVQFFALAQPRDVRGVIGPAAVGLALLAFLVLGRIMSSSGSSESKGP